MSSWVNDLLRGFYVENRQQLYTYAVSITHHREAAEDASVSTQQRGPHNPISNNRIP
jgi:hypothetical protein